MDKSVSIIVPVFNEEKNLPLAISDILHAMGGYRHGYEILIVNDGSTDSTGKIADTFIRTYKCICCIHHRHNEGIGAAFRSGITHAKKQWVVPFHGDNDSSAGSLREMIDRIGEADLISAYTVNTHLRPLGRRIISWSFVIMTNLLFGLSLRYYTGYFLCRAESLRRLRLLSSSPAVYIEAKVSLLKQGVRYIEVPFEHTGRKYGESKTMNAKSIVDAVMTMARLIRQVYFKKTRTYTIEVRGQ